MTFCAFCEMEAEYIISGTNTPICPACKQVYAAGQANTNATFDEIQAEDECGEYISLEECVKSKKHLTSVDDDGYCNFCGEQDSEDEEN